MKSLIIASVLSIVLLSVSSTNADASWRHHGYYRSYPVVRVCAPVRVYAPPVAYYNGPAYCAPRCYNAPVYYNRGYCRPRYAHHYRR